MWLHADVTIARSERQKEKKSRERARERFLWFKPTNTIQLISFHFLPQWYHLVLPVFTTKKAGPQTRRTIFGGKRHSNAKNVCCLQCCHGAHACSRPAWLRLTGGKKKDSLRSFVLILCYHHLPYTFLWYAGWVCVPWWCEEQPNQVNWFYYYSIISPALQPRAGDRTAQKLIKNINIIHFYRLFGFITIKQYHICTEHEKNCYMLEEKI